MPRRLDTLLVALAASSISGCGQLAPTDPQDVLVDDEQFLRDPRVRPEIAAAFEKQARTEFIVEIEAPDVAVPAGQAFADEPRAAALEATKAALWTGLASEAEQGRAFRHLPLVHVRAGSRTALQRLLSRGEVVRIHPNARHEASLTESLSLVGQPAAAAAGHGGAGSTVVVLDTGVRYNLPAFGSCSAPGPSCRVVYAADLAPSDGVLDDVNHGTNVAAIVAGVAPEAKLAVLDVFRSDGYAWSSEIIAGIDWAIANRATYNIVAINMSLGGGGSTSACGSDVFAASIRSARNAGILSVVASGNNGYTDRISSPACVPEAISVGAVYDSDQGARAWSGCSDATTAADKPTCFSNSASFLTLLAPGALISAAGYTMGGTSQAAPHVAGALAVVRAAFPSDSADQALARLQWSGKLVTDPRNGFAAPRIDLEAAVSGSCGVMLGTPTLSLPVAGTAATVALNTSEGCPWTAVGNDSWLSVTPGSGTGSATLSVAAGVNTGAVRTGTVTVGSRTLTVVQAADVDAPTGTVAINGGAATTRSAAVTLTLGASDPVGVAFVCLSNSTTCTSWVPYATTRTWTLASGAAGVRTVSAWFKDSRGNASKVAAKATVTYDPTPPVGGTFQATGSNGQIALSWSGFSDTLTGVAGYVLVSAVGAAPATCTGTPVYSGAGTSHVHSGLVNGTVYGYRLCALDGAGNATAGSIATAFPAPEYGAPTGTLALSSGKTVTRTLAVTLALTASDASTVKSMCLSNTAACTVWENFAATRSWTLATGAAGARTVSVWFRDQWGNAMTTPAKLVLTYDPTPPAGGSLKATGSDGQIALAWSGVTDVLTGIASYVLVAGAGAPPATCLGTPIYTGSATSFAHIGLVNGTVYGYRLCAVDGAGNTSVGLTATAYPAPEYAAPTGTVALSNGLTVTRSRAVSLAIAASDASTVRSMCLSNTTTCAAWESFAVSKTWTLASGNGGLRTVSVWFRDEWGNTSTTPARLTVTYDPVAPVGGSLKATGSDGQIALSWTASTDSLTGVARYLVVVGTPTAPASCAGAPVFSGLATSYTHTGLTNGTVYGYRVCAVDGAGNMSVGWTASTYPAPEYVGPTGSVALQSGRTLTRTLAVTLAISATDASGLRSMCVSNTATCAAWEAFAPSRTWTLATGKGGVRTVSVWFRDVWGNTSSAAATHVVTYDPTPPAGGTLTVTGADAQNTLTWSGFTDTQTGVVGYLLVVAAGTAPANCSGTPVYSGTATSFTHTALANGTVYGYRLCAVDGAGNVSAGLVASAYPAPEYAPPAGTLALANGTTLTRTLSLSLSLSATDASTVKSMCLSNTAACPAWENFATSRTWTLSTGGAGARTVSLWLRDVWGNTTTVPVKLSVTYDPTPPVNGALALTTGGSSVSLSWSGFLDGHSGIETYTVVQGATAAPVSCATGTQLYRGATPAFVHEGVSPGARQYYRVCATDRAGNLSSGVAGSIVAQ